MSRSHGWLLETWQTATMAINKSRITSAEHKWSLCAYLQVFFIFHCSQSQILAWSVILLTTWKNFGAFEAARQESRDERLNVDKAEKVAPR